MYTILAKYLQKYMFITTFAIFLINGINILAKTIKYTESFKQQFLENRLSDLGQT